MEAAFLLGKPIGGEGSGQKERIDKMDKLVILWVAALWFTAAVAILWAIEAAEKLIESRRKEKRPLDCHPERRKEKTNHHQYTTNQRGKAI